VLEKFEEKEKKMPLPKVVQVSNSQLSLINESSPLALTLSWQQVLAKISEALIVGNAVAVLQLLFRDLNYIQLNHNAVDDIRDLVRQPVNENMLIEAQLNLLKKQVSEYLEVSSKKCAATQFPNLRV